MLDDCGLDTSTAREPIGAKPVEHCSEQPATIPFPADGFPPDLTVLKQAAHGSFSEIWKVRERTSGNLLALKRLLPEFQDDPVARQLLTREAAAGRAVAGRHVVRVVRADHESTPPLNLLEWIDGETLQQTLESRQRLPVGTGVWIARQCAQGLEELSRAGFSHGDVKPDNILLAGTGELKLVDLGFAAPLDETRPLGQPRCMTGTPEYMAPESFLRGTVNPQLRDMYSLGVVLYRMLTGRLPFDAPTTEQVLKLHGSARAADLRDLCPAAPEELADLVRRLLAKQPIRRPQSHAALIRELTALELATLHARFAA